MLPAWAWLTPQTRDLFRAEVKPDDATWSRGRGWGLALGLGAVNYYRVTNPVLAADTAACDSPGYCRLPAHRMIGRVAQRCRMTDGYFYQARRLRRRGPALTPATAPGAATWAPRVIWRERCDSRFGRPSSSRYHGAPGASAGASPAVDHACE